MVTLQSQIGPYYPHYLRSLKSFDLFPEGTVKECAIQVMDAGRFAVMAMHFHDYFYKVFSGQTELHESFDEINSQQFIDATKDAAID